MRNICSPFFIVLFIVACGGSMSKEQREEMKDAREAQKIQRVTESELLSEALIRGRRISALIDRIGADETRLDSLADAEQISIRFVNAGSENALEVEKQLVEAYIISSITNGMPDNVQKIGDSLLYSKPEIERLPDGAVQVKGMYSIVFSTKDVVLSIDN